MHSVTLLQLSNLSGAAFVVIAILFNVLVIFAFLGGLGFFFLRFRSGGNVEERLGRMEREIGRLQAKVELLEGGAGGDAAPGDLADDPD